MQIKILFLLITLILSSCIPVQPIIKHQYSLDQFSTIKHRKHSNCSILVNKPSAPYRYNSNEIYYLKQPYDIHTFVHSVWIDPPVDMLLNLIGQSLQNSNYFKVVANSPMVENTKYRLDSQLINMKQNFITKPSTFDFIIKIVLTDVQNNVVIGSRIFHEKIDCDVDTPYGGIVAANKATAKFTKQMVHFIIAQIEITEHKR